MREFAPADVREDPDGNLSCNLNLPATRTILMDIVGFEERLVDKLHDIMNRSRQ
jgi:hypothetical protein